MMRLSTFNLILFTALAAIMSVPIYAVSLPQGRTRRVHSLSSRSRLHQLSPRLFPRVSAESAWNGQVLPGSSTTEQDDTPFVPYYVPDGCYSIDDSNSRVSYHPHNAWIATKDSGCVDHTLHSSTLKRSNASLLFTGTGIEWFGSTSPQHGSADVYLNHRFYSSFDGYSSKTLNQQRLFGIQDLPRGSHLLQIVNIGKTNPKSRGSQVDIDAFVVNPGDASTSTPSNEGRSVSRFSQATQWSLIQSGNTQVAAMQLSVISESEVIIIDKVEHNLLTIDGHPAWGAVYNLNTNAVRPLNMVSNSFCAGGTFLSNGTLISVGGNPVVVDKTGAADFGDVNGLQAVRIFTPCSSSETCDIYENPPRIRLASPRWYNSLTRLDDGSAMIIGGSLKGGWINNETTNNPTIEFYPPKNINGYNGLPVPSSFLSDTLNSNLFPIAFTLPDGTVFIAANNDATIYNWRSNTETRLPSIPNGVRITYPMTGTGTLLPLTPSSNYTPEILLCGGSTLNDSTPGYDLNSQDPASDQCSRIVLSTEGIQNGWQVEQMPEARIMPDSVLLPDGRILFVNGGKTGIAGYGNVQDQVGQSNADNPTYTPVLYDPTAPSGQRFSSAGIPTSSIPRLYHSVATLTPNGTIMIAGSNPNLDRSTVKYQTEYRVEWLWPDYMFKNRPSYDGLAAKVGYGETFELTVTLAAGGQQVQVSLMDLGFVTHAVHMNSRLVILTSALSSDRKTLSITGPPSAQVYPPGPGWIYVVVDGVPSFGHQTLVGTGEGPPVDEGAIENLLNKTSSSVKTSSSSGERR